MSTPTTELGFSYEYAVDVNLAAPGETPEWQQVRFASAIDPQVQSVTEDGATYDDKGAPNPIKLSESWTLGFTIQAHRQTSGAYLPEVEALLAATAPDAVGNEATIQIRYYDNPAEGTPNEGDAFEGDATVQMNRQNTGNASIGGWSVTLTGKGRRRQIENPAPVPTP